jgi:hypothetical protein
MSKKIIAGLFAVLFAVTIVQTSAILTLFNNQRGAYTTKQTAVTAKDFVVNEDLVAAVASSTNLDTDNNSPAVVIFYESLSEERKCYWVEWDANGNWANGYRGNSVYDAGGTLIDCELVLALADGNNDILVSVNFKNGNLNIEGENGIAVLQFKLALAGYLSGKEEITGKMDMKTQTALESFQKTEGLPETGTYTDITKTSLDKIVSRVKVETITGKRFTVTK